MAKERSAKKSIFSLCQVQHVDPPCFVTCYAQTPSKIEEGSFKIHASKTTLRHTSKNCCLQLCQNSFNEVINQRMPNYHNLYVFSCWPSHLIAWVLSSLSVVSCLQRMLNGGVLLCTCHPTASTQSQPWTP
jgi:hypothetical protein